MLRKHFKDIPSDSESTVCHNVQNETTSFRFDYLVARSALESLQAESEGGSFGIQESNINMGDKYFYPVQNRNDIVDLFQNIVESELVKLQELCQQDNNRNKINLTKQETTALKALKMRSDIVIRQADKGGTVVILDTASYKQEALRQLEDHITYRPLSSDPTATIQQKLLHLLDEGKEMGVLDQKTVDYLMVTHPITPVFHHLPKVHKQDNPVKVAPYLPA